MHHKVRNAWLLVALVVIVCVVWPISLGEVEAAPQRQSGGLCPAGEQVTPGYGPLKGPNGSCSVCCDRPGGSSYWRVLPDWHSYCYSGRRPSTPIPTATDRPTPVRYPPPATYPDDQPPFPQPTTNPPPGAVPLPGQEPTSTGGSTTTPTPDAPAPPGEPTPMTNPPAPSAPPAGIAATSTAKTATNTRLGCIPRHAARPLALCNTGSESGWWLYFVGPGGRVITGPHVPYPSPALAGRHLVLRHYISGEPIWLTWQADRLQVRTGYAGKAYVFSVTRDGWVRHEAW